MPQEKFANNAQTTLNGAINNSTTSVVVTSATGFPAAQFRIRVDDEIMLVTAVSSNTFTVTRGQEGTSAASHADLATVRHVLTAEAIGWLGKVVAYGHTSVSSGTGSTAVTISLSGLGITQDMAKLMPIVRIAERVDGSNSADPGNTYRLDDYWFKRSDGASSGVPEEIRLRLTQTGAGTITKQIHWVIIELP